MRVAYTEGACFLSWTRILTLTQRRVIIFILAFANDNQLVQNILSDTNTPQSAEIITPVQVITNMIPCLTIRKSVCALRHFNHISKFYHKSDTETLCHDAGAATH
jgi:hypothetical protein